MVHKHSGVDITILPQGLQTLFHTYMYMHIITCTEPVTVFKVLGRSTQRQAEDCSFLCKCMQLYWLLNEGQSYIHNFMNQVQAANWWREQDKKAVDISKVLVKCCYDTKHFLGMRF